MKGYAEAENVQAGHYIVYIKRESRWYLIDDWNVRAVEEAEACDPRAYMLFYRALCNT